MRYSQLNFLRTTIRRLRTRKRPSKSSSNTRKTMRRLVGNDVATLTICGRLVHGEPVISTRRAIARIAKPGIRVLVLDLKDVHKIDAAGLGLLASALSACHAVGARLKLTNVPSRIREILASTRLDTVLLSCKQDSGNPKTIQRKVTSDATE